jgi:hypothetical protein
VSGDLTIVLIATLLDFRFGSLAERPVRVMSALSPIADIRRCISMAGVVLTNLVVFAEKHWISAGGSETDD